jgi:folate-binding protein YgfZ
MFSLERYKAAHEGAVAADRLGRGRIRLTGKDRLSYLQGVLTNDVAALTPGSGCYAALLTPQGRMISDMRVHELGDATLLDLPGELAERVATHLESFVFSEDVVVENVTQTFAQLVLVGPASFKALSVAPLRVFENHRIRVADAEIIASGNDDFGVPAVDLFVQTDLKSKVLNSLVEQGVIQVDEDVLETMRIEAGVPRFGVDMDHDTIPLEAGIEDRAISLTKGCYVGQEVIIRVLHRGHGRVARRLVGFTFPEHTQPPSRGERVRRDDREIGTITSSAWSPVLARPIALGYVQRAFAVPGTSVDVGPQPATVAAVPFTVPATR